MTGYWNALVQATGAADGPVTDGSEPDGPGPDGLIAAQPRQRSRFEPFAPWFDDPDDGFFESDQQTDAVASGNDDDPIPNRRAADGHDRIDPPDPAMARPAVSVVFDPIATPAAAAQHRSAPDADPVDHGSPSAPTQAAAVQPALAFGPMAPWPIPSDPVFGTRPPDPMYVRDTIPATPTATLPVAATMAADPADFTHPEPQVQTGPTLVQPAQPVAERIATPNAVAPAPAIAPLVIEIGRIDIRITADPAATAPLPPRRAGPSAISLADFLDRKDRSANGGNS